MFRLCDGSEDTVSSFVMEGKSGPEVSDNQSNKEKFLFSLI